MYKRTYITLPNLVLDEPVVPEICCKKPRRRKRSPMRSKRALAAPAAQLADFRRLREVLGPADTLERCARFALRLAGR